MLILRQNLPNLYPQFENSMTRIAILHIKKLGCEYDHWIGDGYCDDINNNMNCSYDGGDCCGPVVNTYYCTDCQCCDANGCNATTANEGTYYS